jgi:serine/threonine protein kinase/tetratricopeptide (TPR) repeat protein
MNEDRWRRVQELFHQATELPPSEHRSFLKAACREDAPLLNEVLALLEQDARGDSLLDHDLAEIAQESMEKLDPGSLTLKEFGPYRIHRVLGEGGMGVVYLAGREDLGSLVAIKILKDAWLSPARRERFALEQRTLAQFNHPFIARLYDANATSDGTPFFVMEYVEGVPFIEYCRTEECSLQKRLELFRAVCEAVVYAHQHAVIHRDLKPSNILVKSDGTVRLLDFGIAKQLETFGAPVDQTITGLRFMTPSYASPEQIRGEQVGIQTDVYSLGVILYELLAGSLPFELSNRTPAQLEQVLTNEEAERPSAVAKRALHNSGSKPQHFATSKSAWADLDVICLTALHKDIQRRYASAEALLRDVDHFLRQEPLDARPDSASYRVKKFVARHRRSVSAAAIAFVIVSALVTYFTVRLAVARNTAVAEAARAERVQKFLFNLFQGGDEAAGPADNLRVVSLLDRGFREAQSLDAEPVVQAELYETLGTIYQKLGKLDRAEMLLQSSLKVRKWALGQNNSAVAGNLVALGMLRAAQARLPEAEQLVRSGLQMSKSTLRTGHPATARAIHALGEVLEDRGEYAKAIPVLEEAVDLQSRPGGVSADLAGTLTELANCHFYIGNYETSDSINRRVLEMDRKLYGERHPHVADDLINLGANQYAWGHYPDAEQFYRQALEIIQAWYGNENPETASALTMVGRALVAQQKFSEAGAIATQALQIQEKVYGPLHPRVASALNEVGKVALQQRKLEEAEKCFAKMVEIYRAVYPNGHSLTGIAEANLASVFMERKQYARAESLYRDALKEYANMLPADHQDVGVGKVKLGRAMLRQKRYADALNETLAGYTILSNKVGASNLWLKNAKQDLVEEYLALKQPQQAIAFRDTLAKPE